jgi:hypothetical protein
MASITGDSQEAVAFALLEKMVDSQQWYKMLSGGTLVWSLSPEELLKRYSQCLRSVKDEIVSSEPIVGEQEA